MIIIILLLVAVAAIGLWQYQLSQANALAAQVTIERIQAQSRLDLAPWVILGLLVVAVTVVLVTYFRRPPAIVNQTMYLMLPPGQSRRQYLKDLGSYEALPLAKSDYNNLLQSKVLGDRGER